MIRLSSLVRLLTVKRLPMATDVAVSTLPDATDPSATGIAADAASGKIRKLSTVLLENPRVLIETPRLKGSINLQGARIDDLTLTDHRVALDKKSAPVRLFSPTGTKDAYFSRFGWAGDNVKLPDGKTVWNASASKLTPQSPVTLSWDNQTGQNFAMIYSIDENYLITVKQSVTNASDNAIALNSYGLISRVRDLENVPTGETSSFTIHIGPIGVFTEDGNQSAEYGWDYDDIVEEGEKGVPFDASNGWIGFTDKYWLAALIPGSKEKTEAKFRSGKGNIFQAQTSGKDASVVAPGKTLTKTSRLFAGAKETALLDSYKEEQNITLFDKAIDWGWFYWFEKPLFYLLNWLFKMVGNFGVAIVLMTFIVRGIMFPIAQKQFKSMAQMRAVQPKMKKIQEKHKEDKQKQQQEIMKLYKTEKVNPLAGCLPIFLQIPIFFALYKVLMLSH